jgi:hypothetical protein
MDDNPVSTPTPAPHRRRPRYRGTHPHRFEDKYKERQPDRYANTVAKVLASGKTPAGTHRPIMVAEILEVLAPQPGEFAVDCTLGYGGHAQEILARIRPGGKLLGLDIDPVELPKTEARLRALGFGDGKFSPRIAAISPDCRRCWPVILERGCGRIPAAAGATTSFSPTSAFPRCKLTIRRAAFP